MRFLTTEDLHYTYYCSNFMSSNTTITFNTYGFGSAVYLERHTQPDPINEFQIGDRVKLIRELLQPNSNPKWINKMGTIIKINFEVNKDFPFFVRLDDPSLADNHNLGCNRFEIEKVIELKGGEEKND